MPLPVTPCRRNRRSRLERVALDAPPLDRDEPEASEANDRRRVDAVSGELGGGEPVGRGPQPPERRPLPLAETRRFERRGVESLRRRVHDAHGPGRVGAPLQRPRQRDQAVTLERRERRVRAARRTRDRADRRHAAPRQPFEHVAPQPALGEQPRLAGVGDRRVPLALHPRARRHRGRDRLPDAARVVLRHPLRQPNDRLRKERLGIQHVDDVLGILPPEGGSHEIVIVVAAPGFRLLQLLLLLFCFVASAFRRKNTAGDNPVPERNEHPHSG
ncbi:MAG: hypothetical protein DMF85_14850 [Acidobacteria bacterium]|nr:MAG: hypothetical protein DMF85_14850 [Acidobacteriota bacterium]